MPKKSRIYWRDQGGGRKAYADFLCRKSVFLRFLSRLNSRRILCRPQLAIEFDLLLEEDESSRQLIDGSLKSHNIRPRLNSLEPTPMT